MNQSSNQVLVIGGGYAGLMAASRAASAGDHTQVTLVEPRSHFVQRIRLHEMAVGREPKTLLYKELLAKRSIQYLQGNVVELDMENQKAKIAVENGVITQYYDYLVNAVGSEFDVPDFLQSSPYLFSIHNEEMSNALFEYLLHLPDSSNCKLLVIGDGFTAIELCAELAERFSNCNVSMAGSAQPFAQFSEKGQTHLKKVFNDLSICFISDRVIDCEDSKVYFDSGHREEFDCIIYCGGFRGSAGTDTVNSKRPISVDDKSRIKTNSYLQIEHYPSHYVAGDAGIVELEGDPQKAVRMGCVSAMPMGAHAGENIARAINGKAAKPFRFGFAFRCLSLGRNNALIQFTDNQDRAKNSILTGRTAVLFKEFICRLTYYSILMEYKTGYPVYVWLQPKSDALQEEKSKLA